MGAIDIWAEGLSKRYKIGHARRHDSLKEFLGETLRGRGVFQRRADQEAVTLWALGRFLHRRGR